MDVGQPLPQVKSAVLHRDLHRNTAEIVEAKGSYFTLSNKRKILDASTGAAVSCIGHGNVRVQKALAAQVTKLDYCVSIFFTNKPAEELCRVLIDSTNGHMARAFIANSGSEAMDAAIKLARQYFMELTPPQPQRIRLIARQGSYHGNTLGALSASGHKARRAIYEPMLLPNVSHVSACNPYRGKPPEENMEAYVDRLADELDQEFQRVGPDTVCAFIAEPVVGAALGCVPSLPGYLQAMRKVCDKYGALLILDEVMCGMGRTGTMHAWQQEGVIPDIQTMGKGLGGGYVPIAGVLASNKVIEVLDNGTGQFVHGQTYQAHPLVCAAALEVQRIIAEDNLLANVRAMGTYLERALRTTLGKHPHVGNIRGRGLFWGLEFVYDRESKKPFAPVFGLALAVHDEALNQDPGVMVYPATGSADGWQGDHVIIAPPYNIKEAEIDLIVLAVGRALNSALSKLIKEVWEYVEQVLATTSSQICAVLEVDGGHK